MGPSERDDREALASSVWQRMFELFQSRKDELLAISAEVGLTPAHMHALLALDPDAPKPMGSLAADWKCDASNVTFLADRLEEAGYVERRVSPTDRRVKILALTDAGHAARDRLRRRMSEPPDALLTLTVDQLAALDGVLAALRSDEGA
ncbi:MAG: MarR family transcriptional regulator [Acidimicrobiales bacterium]|nr:MarR family transcriptional regulator [Acidimicrobiales bacterium]MCB9373158.1 MarR family transcriptional regulator [Microthrixaceae bacterium]